MAIRTGEQFLAGLRDDREVWLEGERVEDVTTHPKLARMAQTLAGVYDLQHDPALHDEMTFESPSSGEAVPLSYLIPRTAEDIDRRHRALEIVAASCHGILGRTPDYVNVQVTAARQFAALFGVDQPWLGENLVAYHEYIRENDLCLTHAFGHPQVNRGAALTEQPDPYVATGIVETTDDGVVVRGCETARDAGALRRRAVLPSVPRGASRRGHLLPRLLGPRGHAGPQVHLPRELRHGQAAVRPAAFGTVRRDGRPRGVRRRAHTVGPGFSYNDVELHNRLIGSVPMWRQYMQQVMLRTIAKLEFMLGVAHELTGAIGIGGFAHIQEKMAEIIDTIETVRSYLRAAEADAGPWEGEGIALAPEPCIAMRHTWPDAFARVAAIMQQLAAGGLMLTPTEEDMTGAMASTADRYFQGVNIGAHERVRLFRLVWDLIGTQFGSRSALYERYFNGDVVRLRQLRFANYDYTRAKQSYQDFLSETESS